ncbi:twisted gastrulation protein homolog 1-A-like isoform X2 [Centruroides sculpturatus]|nr:twisted gastrulation protein homolog 1-A-like isoform X2 [Centruroides sculpturatus]XP_023217071.1 twisted gastrulation protein homolog 1-A-like isoform X2 [Centruroides sculpturatus]
MKWVAVFLFCGFIPLYVQEEKPGCNEAVCASIVSKCMLTQSCKCDNKNATCSRDCFHCLDYLYSECCVCVDMCPKPNLTDTELGQKSHVEEFSEPVPELFIALTEEKDPHSRWISYTFPVHFSLVTSVGNEHVTLSPVIIDEELPSETKLLNCTVAFLSQCMSFSKCKDSCRSMGSSSCRWFHDGCCECIGSTCLNYGMNEGRCLECPKEFDSEDDLIESDQNVETSTNSEKPNFDYEEKKIDTSEEEKLQKIDS